jgi:hypothetical protein
MEKIRWFDFHFSITPKTNAVPIMKFINDNFNTEHLNYNETYFYDYASDDGPVRSIEFKAPAIDGIDIMQHLVDEFEHPVVFGHAKPFKWAHPVKISKDVIEDVRKRHKKYKIKRKKK